MDEVDSEQNIPQEQPPVETQKIKKRKFPTILVIIGVIVLLLAAGGAFAYFQLYQTNEPVACTAEAKQCPDGSYVGRIGPNCEFAECPDESDEQKEAQAMRNLRLHRDAVANNDVSLCDQISGVGYGFGPIDELVYVSQEQATEWCRRDAEAGFIASGEFQELIEWKLNEEDQTIETYESDDIAPGDYQQYLGKSCNNNNDCGGFPCVDEVCFIKQCKKDSDCPGLLCSQFLSPTPHGYCTDTDVK